MYTYYDIHLYYIIVDPLSIHGHFLFSINIIIIMSGTIIEIIEVFLSSFDC